MKKGMSPMIFLIMLLKLEGRAADYRSFVARNDLHDGKIYFFYLLFFIIKLKNEFLDIKERL